MQLSAILLFFGFFVFMTNGNIMEGDFIHENVARVAVIGAGPGGASATYFLRKEMGKEVDIEVFEKNKVPGGRVRSSIIAGQTTELGGAVYHKDNKLMADFVRLANLSTFNPIDDHPDPKIEPPKDLVPKSTQLGVWNGKEFLFQTYENFIFNTINGLWRYGIDSKYVNGEASNILHKFLKIYELLDERAFSTVDELLDSLDLNYLTKISLEDHLFSNSLCGYNNGSFCKEIVTGLTRVNYGQSAQINALVGLIALIGSTGDVFGVVGGNYQAMEFALAASNSLNHYESSVSAIIKDKVGDSVKYSIEYTDSENNIKIAEGFDKIVIAAPLEFANIECRGFDLPKEGMQKRAYQLTHVSIVVGDLNLSGYFGVDESSRIQKILTTEDPDIEFSSIMLHTEYNAQGEIRNLYKVFSRNRLSEEKLNELFTNIQTIYQTEFYAYPVLDVLPKDVPFPPLILDEKNIFYVNALESPFSTIETEMISGKNIAKLLAASF